MRVFINNEWVTQDAVNTFSAAKQAWYDGNAAAGGVVGNVVCDSYLTQSYHYDANAVPPADGTEPQPTMFDGTAGWGNYDSTKYPNDNHVIAEGQDEGPLPTPTT